MILVSAAALSILVLTALLLVRETDLHKPTPVSPFQHLDERKAAIYENLRDLQFEFRVGKLSDADYQQTKLDLQRELAQVMAQADQLKSELKLSPQPVTLHEPRPTESISAATRCSTCGATFPQPLKFCGECGAPMGSQQKGQRA